MALMAAEDSLEYNCFKYLKQINNLKDQETYQ